MLPYSWKTVTAPPIELWEGVESHSITPAGLVIINPLQGKAVACSFTPLRPDAPVRLRAKLEFVSAGSPGTISFAEQARTLTPGSNSVEFVSTLPVEPLFTITGATQIRISSLEMQILQPSSSTPLPYDLLGFDVYLPTRAPAFIVGKSRIGSAPLGGEAVNDGFTIGESRLNINHLPVRKGAYYWRNLMAPGIAINVRMGANAGSGLLPVAQAGTATITLKNIDPRELNLSIGARCRIYHRLSRELIFTGTLKRFTLTPGKETPKPDLATLEFVDTVGALANIKRYGARSASAETLTQRVERLMKDTGLEWEILPNTPAVADQHAPTVMEGTLAAYLDMTTATVGGAWWIDATGKIIINPNIQTRTFHERPYFVIGESPLDEAKLADPGVYIPPDPGTQVQGAYVIGKSELNKGKVAATAPYDLPDYVIGESKLNHSRLTVEVNNVEFAQTLPAPPPLLTDSYHDQRPGTIYYTDLEPGFSSEKYLTEVEVENHAAKEDPDGGISDGTVTYRALNDEAAKTYGRNAKKVKACCATPETAKALAQWLLDRPISHDPAALDITSVKINGLKTHHRLNKLALFSQVETRYRGARADYLIYAIEHRLTPTKWSTRLYLTAASEERITI